MKGSATCRTSSIRDRRRIPQAIAVAVALIMAGFVAASTATDISSATARVPSRTVSVHFTADGPTPEKVTLHAGDSVQFVNDDHPGVVAVAAVSITVAGATSTAFTLPPGAAATVGPYEGVPNPPQPIRYTADYHASLAGGMVPAGEHRTAGSISVIGPAAPPTCNPSHACPQLTRSR